ncbi:ExbD/TolR family protein [Prosthecochloris vibrioformis]|uniref:Biopolymer transporter ExbD n=1 Tax=Prosthecochloris vibrioformis TaxID=1098 RepID=A0A5C4S400_PROVB|nr:biopolymer transporter ExbD [Prosthecochloris vibrioformis]TNJ38114.1 biopolymer transporter ExbD [Prosthecochloris vibrioformis]
MGMVDAPNDRKAGRKGRRRKRLGFHLDMTPMVDVAFLLLTFFMLTTTFSKSNTMEINIPPESGEVKIAEHNVLTLRVVDQAEVYWAIGEQAPQRIPLYEAGLGSEAMMLSEAMRMMLRQQTAANERLVIVVKLSPKAKYKYLVDLIDEFNLLALDRFSLDDFTGDDARAVGLSGVTTNHQEL